VQNPETAAFFEHFRRPSSVVDDIDHLDGAGAPNGGNPVEAPIAPNNGQDGSVGV